MKKRDERLDIIRIFALICVIGVHYFLSSGFYEATMCGEKMLIMCIARAFFIICVPVFITLTGYLMNKKTISKKYYKGIVKTLIIYFICSIVYHIFYIFYRGEGVRITTFFKNVLAYKGTIYAWYIEMYIGLFLLIPFLNLIFNNLKNKKEAKVLLITLAFLTGLPCIANIFKYYSIRWWLNPSINSEYVKLLPDWWAGIYPLFYYFLGAYLNKYEVKISKKMNIILLFIIIILSGIFDFYRSYGTKFITSTWNSYPSITIMVTTFLTFNLLLKIKLKTENEKRGKILKILSDACLGAYLVSCIFDIVYYDKLNKSIAFIKDRFIYAPLMVILVVISSMTVSILINCLYNAGKKGIEKLVTIYKNKEKNPKNTY